MTGGKASGFCNVAEWGTIYMVRGRKRGIGVINVKADIIFIL